MSEIKLLIYLVGIPTYIYAFFLDMASGIELWKGIILTAIGSFTGVVIGCRQLVRLLKEWREYKKDAVKK